MRAAPLRGDCIVCQAPEAIRTAVNAAIWHEGSVVRVANYRAAGSRAAAQVGMTMAADTGKWDSLDPRTITRHADHIEETWRDVLAGERLEDDEIPVATDFGSVTDAAAEVGMLSMRALRELIRKDPKAFAALRTKEAIALAKVGVAGATAKETSRLKKNQQAIDVMAIFAGSAGFMPQPDPDDTVEGDIVDMKAAVAAERLLLTART